MARLALCLSLALGLVGCREGDEDARLLGRVQALTASLDEARTRSSRLERRLEREHRRRVALAQELGRSEGVDLWTGGPTIDGTFLALPRLGTLRWECDDDRRFNVAFAPAGASVRVAYETPIRARSRMLHSHRTMTATLGEDETMTWTITHRHPPGFIRAHIAVTTGLSRHGGCLLTDVELDETGRLYD